MKINWNSLQTITYITEPKVKQIKNTKGKWKNWLNREYQVEIEKVRKAWEKIFQNNYKIKSGQIDRKLTQGVRKYKKRLPKISKGKKKVLQ